MTDKKKGLQKIGLQIPKIVLRAAGKKLEIYLVRKNNLNFLV